MEALRRTFAQYRELFAKMTPSQRGTLVLVPLVVGAALALLVLSDSSASYVALSWGKTFTTEEMMNAEQTLIDAGLADFRREGQRLLVPRSEADRYNAALLEGGSLPQGWGDELEQQLAQTASPFRTQQESETARDVALARALQRMIRAVPDIEHADVIWAGSNARPRMFGRPSPVTATVSVRPRKGRELSSRLVQSLRAAVASMVPNLKSADVTVFDQSTGTAHTPETDGDPFDTRVLDRVRRFEGDYRAKIRDALSYIEGVLVTVHVDIDNLKRSVKHERSVDPKKTVSTFESTRRTEEQFTQQPQRSEPGAVSNQPRNLNVASGVSQERTNNIDTSSTVNLPWVQVTEEELIGAMPKAVQVSVKIPEDYYEAVALSKGYPQGTTDVEKAAFRKAVDEIRQREEAQAKATAAILIPAGSPEQSVNVSSFVAIEPQLPDTEIGTFEIVRELVSQWWSTVALGLFALWALWTLRRNMPRLPDVQPLPARLPPPEVAPDQATAEPPMEEGPREPTRRELVQSIVRDDPEMTAGILNRWIEAAK